MHPLRNFELTVVIGVIICFTFLHILGRSICHKPITPNVEENEVSQRGKLFLGYRKEGSQHKYSYW